MNSPIGPISHPFDFAQKKFQNRILKRDQAPTEPMTRRELFAWNCEILQHFKEAGKIRLYRVGLYREGLQRVNDQEMAWFIKYSDIPAWHFRIELISKDISVLYWATINRVGWEHGKKPLSVTCLFQFLDTFTN